MDARKHYDRATAAFGLGKYAEAAAEYEAAFRLRPDPALLYNCAQSYRLAGDRPRAIELYRNYLRLYGDAPNAEDARKHLGNLERGGRRREAGHRRADAAATSGARAAASGRAGAVAVAAAARTATARARTGAARARGSCSRRPRGARRRARLRDSRRRRPTKVSARWSSAPGSGSPLGAVVVAGVAVALIATGGDKDPSASLGTVVAN